MTSLYFWFTSESWISSRENPICSIISEQRKDPISMWVSLKTGTNQTFLSGSLPTSLFGVFVIRLGFDVRFELLLLIAHVHPPVPHYLLLGKTGWVQGIGGSQLLWEQAYLEAASFGGVQYEELFEQVLAVGGHVERNPVFAAQHALSQLLVKDEDTQSELTEANNNITFDFLSLCLPRRDDLLFKPSN